MGGSLVAISCQARLSTCLKCGKLRPLTCQLLTVNSGMLLALDSRSSECSCILWYGSKIHQTLSQEWISFWALLTRTELKHYLLCLTTAGIQRASLDRNQHQFQVSITQDGCNLQELMSIPTKLCSQFIRSISSTLLASSRMTPELSCGTFIMNQATLNIFQHQCLCYKELSHGQDKLILLSQFLQEYGTGGSTLLSLTTTNWKTLMLSHSMIIQMWLIRIAQFRTSKYMVDQWLLLSTWLDHLTLHLRLIFHYSINKM